MIWRDEEVDDPLSLALYQHEFGVMEGTEDPHLKRKVMATMRRAFEASAIQKDLRLIKSEGIKKTVYDMLVLAMEADYARFDSEDPYCEIQDRGLAICRIFISE